MHGIRNKRKVIVVKRRSWKSECMGIDAASLKVFLSQKDLKTHSDLLMKQDLHSRRILAPRS